LLEGKSVNLRVVEKEDLGLLAEWVNKPEVFGEFNPLRQSSRADMERMRGDGRFEAGEFFIENKDGGKVGYVWHFNVMHPVGKFLEIGYFLVPDERGKGYCTEAVGMMADYLFLSRDVMRIQAITDVRNVGSQRVLEKAGFRREGTLRKLIFMRGDWRDAYVYSILREEWKEPRILTRTA